MFQKNCYHPQLKLFYLHFWISPLQSPQVNKHIQKENNFFTLLELCKKQTPLLSLLLSKQSKSCKAWYLPLQTIRPRWITTKSVGGVWILFISLNLKQALTLVNFFPPQLQLRHINFCLYSTWKLLKGIVPDTRSIHRSFFTILSLQEHTASNFSN